MSNSDQAASSQAFEGSMFLYDRPALLTKEDHNHLGLSAPERPFDFVKDVKGLPIVTNEIQTAQKFYPVIFSEFENPILLAIVGIIDDVNLFVGDDGMWDRNSYVPSYVRCHPFALANRGEGEYAVMIDESSDEISENPQVPFFDGEEMNEAIQPRLDLCGQFNMESQRSKEFCARVKELGLLNGQRVAHTDADGNETKIADYVTIDPNRLRDLDKDVLQELHQDGSLAAIYGQMFSLENWNRLIGRRALLQDAS